ncbi:hypothetical protein [Priestia aryabhattai]|uniref:hypothetical protein n=1 Tax=Priestia aryabhattai TaxID=412384 RepID=UPI0030EE8184
MELQKRKGKEDYPITESESGKYRYINSVSIRITIDENDNIKIDDQQENRSFWGTIKKGTSLHEQLKRLFDK